MKILLFISSCFVFGVFGCEKEKASETIARSSEISASSTSAPKSSEENRKISYDNFLKINEIDFDSRVFGGSENVSRLSDNALEKLIEKASSVRYGNGSEVFVSAACEFAVRYPGKVMSWFSLDSLNKGDNGLNEVLSVLGQESPIEIRRWLETEVSAGSREEKDEYNYLGLFYLSESLPTESLDYLVSTGEDFNGRSAMICRIFSSFRNKSGGDLLKIAQEKLAGRERELAFREISVSQDNYANAFEIAGKIRSENIRGNAFSRILERAVVTDPEMAKTKLDEMDARDLQSVLTFDSTTKSNLIRQLSQKSPDYLVSMMERVTPSVSTSNIYKNVIKEMVSVDFQKSSSIINNLPESDFRNDLISEQYEYLAASDPANALVRAEQDLDGSARSRAFSKIGLVVGQKSLEEVTQYAEGLRGKDRSNFFSSAIIPQIVQNPEDVSDFLSVEQFDIDDQTRNMAYSLIGNNLARQDVTRSKEWLATLANEQKASATRGVAESMAQSDPVALGQFLGEIEQDQAWMEGVKVLIANIRDSDPERAAQWQEQLDASREDEPEE
jgi:hypothetical protein